jgi:hypothetical protein
MEFSPSAISFLDIDKAQETIYNKLTSISSGQLVDAEQDPLF